MNFEEMVQASLLSKTELERQQAEENLHALRLVNAQYLKRAKANTIEAEESLAEFRRNQERNKEQKRPSRERWVDISYDSAQDRWIARHSNVEAYGDTPEMACDNFDHLWVFGYK